MDKCKDRGATEKTPQLSCELCRERKVKCDKLTPCSNCARTGAVCVPIHRKRLPRGRHAHQHMSADEDLKKRIRRLEALVDSLNSTREQPRSREQSAGSDIVAQISTPTSPRSATSSSSAKRTMELGLKKQGVEHFWADLVEEIHGLRGAIDEPSEEEDVKSTPESHQSPPSSTGTRVLGFSSPSAQSPHVSPGHLNGWNELALSTQLCQVYLRQVDPIIKILHRPSLCKFMVQGEGYLNYEHGHASTDALAAAIHFSAVNSMSEDQCQSMFQSGKAAVYRGYRRACEAALDRADLVTTRDMTVLQAFVLYLVAKRSEDVNRGVWTLVAVVVRIARALALYLENDRSECIFVRELRRRLWCTICVMDLQASFEQASEPLINLDMSQSVVLPKNVNDADFDPSTVDELYDREELTDMTFALVTYNAQLSGRLLNFVAGDDASKATGGGGGGTYNWDARQAHVERFETEARRLLQFCDAASSPYAWFAFHGSQSLMASMRLSALRPLYRAGSGAPPRVQGSTHLLRVSLDVLDEAHLVRTDVRGEGFRWYVTIQWHALAIAITECYVCADASLLRAAWPVIAATYRQHAAIIAEYRSGVLRGPLEKIMRRTRKKVGPLIETGDGVAVSSSSSSGSGSPAMWSGLPDHSNMVVYPSPTRSNAVLEQENVSGPPTAVSVAEQRLASLDFNSFPGVNTSAITSNPLSPSLTTQIWYSPQLGFDGQDTTMPEMGGGGGIGQNIPDAAWGTWEEFVSGLSFGNVPGGGFQGPLFDHSMGY